MIGPPKVKAIRPPLKGRLLADVRSDLIFVAKRGVAIKAVRPCRETCFVPLLVTALTRSAREAALAHIVGRKWKTEKFASMVSSENGVEGRRRGPFR